MRTLLLILFCIPAKAANYTIFYKHQSKLKLHITAESKLDALKKASKLCFQTLNPKYTTEEAGLEAIDVCANGIVTQDAESACSPRHTEIKDLQAVFEYQEPRVSLP